MYTKAHGSLWCEQIFKQCFYAFCPDERAWRLTLRHLKIDIAKNPYPPNEGKDGTALVLTKQDERPCVIVTVRENGRDLNQLVGILAHEAVHVWQTLRAEMGEKYPSDEFEAYSIQQITQELFIAYEDSRKVPPAAKRKVKRALQVRNRRKRPASRRKHRRG